MMYWEKDSLNFFALINNKKYEGYNLLFNKIKYVLTIENSTDLKLESYTLDFEIALQNTMSNLFPNQRCIGCYYHYCRNLREKGREYKLLNKDYKDNTQTMLNQLYKLPFNYINYKKLYQESKKIYIEISDTFVKYYKYFEKQWIPFFENNKLNYSYLNRDERSNSYIENYNRVIKLKLSKYLYGKNHCKISWPLFMHFIKNEEEEYIGYYIQI